MGRTAGALTDVQIPIELQIIGAESVHLPRIKQLHRTHAKTLGMFPAGAFDEYASCQQIIGAITPGHCVGYLLYRVAKERAVIVHLCVDAAYRGKGLSRLMVGRLSELSRNQGLRGIALRCRRDFEASRLWPRLGFIPLVDKPGRSRDGTQLTLWWLDHKQPDLFSLAPPLEMDESRLPVVIDANVFFDLHDEADPESTESKALDADWLQDTIELCLTSEILIEIHRNTNKELRDRQRLHVSQYRVLDPSQPATARSFSAIRRLFPDLLTDNDESDLRHVAKAVAEGIQFFVTRDKRLLEKSDQMYAEFGILILRPTALINRLDTLRRESEYQPFRLGGSRFRIRRATSADESTLAGTFQASGDGERETAFLRIIRHLLGTPQSRECFVAENEEATPLAVYGYVRDRAETLEIPLLRIARTTVGPTIVRHLLARALQTSAEESRVLTSVTEERLDEVTLTALIESGFSLNEKQWLKLNLGIADTAKNILCHLNHISASSNHASTLAAKIASVLTALPEADHSVQAIALERALWPAKILDSDVPSFIVPIRAGWAQSLFDEGLANQELFGERPELVLKREQVYYRASHPCGLKWPGRILWYVSADSKRQGTMCIRACSRLEEVIVDTPKELFGRFRRLGVYSWRDIFKKANQDLAKPLMALRFTDTELFKTPVSRDLFRNIGIKSNLQSPVRITPEQFAAIYHAGIAQPIP